MKRVAQSDKPVMNHPQSPFSLTSVDFQMMHLQHQTEEKHQQLAAVHDGAFQLKSQITQNKNKNEKVNWTLSTCLAMYLLEVKTGTQRHNKTVRVAVTAFLCCQKWQEKKEMVFK